MNEYTKQRLESAELIGTRLHALAKKHGIKIQSITWNESDDIDGRSTHKILVEANGQSSSGSISDEALADYQGKVGTEKTEAMLVKLIDQLARNDASEKTGTDLFKLGKEVEGNKN